MGPEDDDDRDGRGTECDAYRSGSESYMDNLRGYAATPSGPLPSVQLHPGKGQCALCGRWFCRSIKDTSVRASKQTDVSEIRKRSSENDAIYKDDRDGLRGPLPPVIHGVLSPERQCRR